MYKQVAQELFSSLQVVGNDTDDATSTGEKFVDLTYQMLVMFAGSFLVGSIGVISIQA